MATGPQRLRAPTGDLAYLVEAMHHLSVAWLEAMKRNPVVEDEGATARAGRLEMEQAEQRYKAVQQAAIAYLSTFGVANPAEVVSALTHDYHARFAPPDTDV